MVAVSAALPLKTHIVNWRNMVVNYRKMTKNELINVIERKNLLIQQQEAAIDCVTELINNSNGVAGLHLNGDLAEWDELLLGGVHEEWLGDFDVVRMV